MGRNNKFLLLQHRELCHVLMAESRVVQEQGQHVNKISVVQVSTGVEAALR